MRFGNLSKAFVIAATVVWAAGCSTGGTTTDSGQSMDADQTPAEQGAASSTGTMGDSSMSGSTMGGDTGASMMEQTDLSSLQTVFYFDFDKAVVKTEAFEDLSAHAKYLADHPATRVVLEGHADERGTREYNMALGERRAKAVSRYLTVQGVSSAQIEVVSYGEERPAEVGHSEMSWSKNRRVELKYVH